MNKNQQIQSAMDLLSQGKVAEADHIFSAILEQDPLCADAWHGRACVARSVGEYGLAIGLAGQAIQLQNSSYYHITLGLALFEQGHMTEGEAALKAATLLNPYDARAFNSLGMVQEQLQHIPQSEFSLKKACELQPDYLLYRVDLNRFYWRQQNYDHVLLSAREGVKKNLGNIDFLNELMQVLYALNLFNDAELIAKKIVKLSPNNPIAQANLGAILFELNRVEEARPYLKFAVEQDDVTIETLTNYALVQMAVGELSEAYTSLKKAYEQSSENRKIGLNFGTILYELKYFDQAEKLYRTLLTNDENNQVCDLDYHRIEYNLSTLLLAKGHFLDGWKLMEARKYILPMIDAFNKSQIPMWDGSETVKKLLIRVEQGLGDAIQFIRFLPTLVQKYSVIIESPPILISLIKTVLTTVSTNYTWQVIEQNQELPLGVSHQSMLMSLPYLLQINSIPVYYPYLQLDENNDLKQEQHRQLDVGICWAGNHQYRFDAIRSININDLLPILDIDGVDFHSLQYDVDANQLPSQIKHILPKGDLLKTAQYIQQLDLVITVDTVIAHLAGAIGKEVWLLNRYGGDWRWHVGSQNNQGDNLWYPTIKVFQQQENLPPDQSWKSVIDQVKTKLIQVYVV